MNGGNGRVAQWITGGLFMLLTAVSGFIANQFNNRLTSLETAQLSRTDTKAEVQAQMSALQTSICRLEEKLDDFREAVTRRPVFRRPCP